jgi:predicted Holliday junction resolvase-like endonuclease
MIIYRFQFHTLHHCFKTSRGKEERVTPYEYFLILVVFSTGLLVSYMWYRTQVCVIEGRAQNNLDRWKNEHTKEICKDSVNRSRSTLKGRISKQKAPLLPDFPYSLADAGFIWNPIGFVIFDGYTEAKDGKCSEIRDVLVEVKKGKGRFTREELLIKNAIEESRVAWKTIFLTDDAPGNHGHEVELLL